LFANHAANEYHWFKETGARLALYPLDRRILAFPGLGLGIPLLAVFLWERAGSRARAAMVILLLLPASLVVASLWDSRAPLQRAVEASAFRPDVFGTPIPASAQIVWEPESLVAVWMVLQRPSFYSPGQLAGQMFSRDTALEGKAREDRLLPLLRESAACRDESLALETRRACHISNRSLVYACSATTRRAPDFVVLPYPQPEPARGSWGIEDPTTGEVLAVYRLYACSDITRGIRTLRDAPPGANGSVRVAR